MDPTTETLMEDYLFDRLSTEQAEKLRTKASTDDDFAQLLALRKLEVDAMAIAEKDALCNTMSTWNIGSGPAMETSKPALKLVHRRKAFTRVLSIAAGFLLLVFAGTSFFATSNYSNEALAERYSRSRIAGARGTSDAAALEPIKTLMAQGQYEQAISEMENMEGNATALLRAEAYFKLALFENSLQEYDKVAASDSQLADEAAFQSALTLLAAGKTAEAKVALEKINADPANTFAQNATQVLNELDSVWRKIAW